MDICRNSCKVSKFEKISNELKEHVDVDEATMNAVTLKRRMPDTRQFHGVEEKEEDHERHTKKQEKRQHGIGSTRKLLGRLFQEMKKSSLVFHMRSFI